ncbi:unnamed protein product [Spodoptera exigua]|nr:unnamed protein product [Spodoptera exigua]
MSPVIEGDNNENSIQNSAMLIAGVTEHTNTTTWDSVGEDSIKLVAPRRLGMKRPGRVARGGCLHYSVRGLAVHTYSKHSGCRVTDPGRANKNTVVDQNCWEPSDMTRCKLNVLVESWTSLDPAVVGA